jgi:hypothetical protein
MHRRKYNDFYLVYIIIIHMTNPTTRDDTYEHPSFDNGCLMMMMMISKKTESSNLSSPFLD